MLEAVGILTIFMFVLGLSYFATKQIARMKQGDFYHKNLKVIEVLQLCPGQYLYLVEIGGNYYLFSGTKEHLAYCMEIAKEDLVLEEIPTIPFKEQLLGLLKGKEEHK
jgi:flagellar biogenesis protein FliO